MPLVEEQIAKARALYNDLVACMRYVFAEISELTLQLAGPEARALVEKIDQLTKSFDEARATDDRDLLKSIAVRRKEARDKLFPLLGQTRKRHAADLHALYSKVGKNATCSTYKVRTKAVQDGLGWATANAILDNSLRSWKSSLTQGHSPRFSPGEFKLRDVLTLQFTEPGGLTTDKLFNGSHKQIKLLAPEEPGRKRYGSFCFRLGNSDADKYASGTWQYHRRIPESCRIALARLVRRRIGKDVRYSLQLVANLGEPLAPPANNAERGGLVAIHFGWAADITGRRVASVANSSNPNSASLLQLPPDIEADLTRAANIQAKRDSARDLLALVLRKLDIEPWPETLQEHCKVLRRLPTQQISLSRLHKFCRLLMAEGLVVPEIEEWRLEDRRRWQDTSHLSRRARNRRREHWRDIAINLVTHYRAIAIEPLDLARMAIKQDADSGKYSELARNARAGRVVAGIFELETAIRWACQKTRTPLLEISAQTVAVCAHCGGSTIPDELSSHVIHCIECGSVVDRKSNGAARAFQIIEPHLDELCDAYLSDIERIAVEAAERRSAIKAKLSAGRSKARVERTRAGRSNV